MKMGVVMRKNMKKLVSKLDERGLSQIDIYGILALSHDNEDIINELINYIDNTNKTKHDLKSDLLKLENELRVKDTTTEKEESNISKLEDEQDDSISTSVHTVRYKRESNSDELLHVAYNKSNIGELRILGLSTKLNYFCVGLSLAYMDLLELKNDTRESFRKLDLYKYDGEKIIYSFQPAIEQFNSDIDNYKQIIIWTKHNNTNAYLLPYYFINKFYEKIKKKKIMLIYTDELAGCDDLSELKIGQFQDLVKTAKVLTKEEIDNYSNEWNEISSHKCDIRNLVNDKLEYKNIEDYYDTIKELLKKDGEIYRTKFIGKLMNKNVLCGGIPDIYSYIIDKMIEQGIISSKDYKVPNFIPADKISIKND